MLIASYQTFLTHSFIGVFTDTPRNALPDWTDDHVLQGFTWRPTSVSFGTASDCGDLRVEVEHTPQLTVRASALRVIQVPLLVDETCVFQDGGNFVEVAVEHGQYTLVFQHGWKPSDAASAGELTHQWCVFSFVPDDNPQFAILRADEEIQTLLMSAEQ